MIHLKAAFYARALLLLAAMIVSCTFAQNIDSARTMQAPILEPLENQVNQTVLEVGGFPFTLPVPSELNSKNVFEFEMPKPKPARKQTTPKKLFTNTKITSTIKAQARIAKKSKAKFFSSLTVRSTAYNSIPNQTDSSPFHTATGARTRYGIIALSRDLLRRIPYGSRVRLQDIGAWSSGRGSGKYNAMLKDTIFVVEDTMHPRKNGTVDVWLPARRQAMQWGVRRLNLQVVQVGR